MSMKRFTGSFLGVALALLLFCAALTFAVDPFYQYRVPAGEAVPLFSERYQLPGVARHFSYDAALIGSSMAENNRQSWYSEAFSCTAQKFTFAGGYFPEYDAILTEIFAARTPERVFFSVDLYALMADPGYTFFTNPGYLYGTDVSDDAKYLLNKDVLTQSLPTYLSLRRGWTGRDTDDAFAFESTRVYSREAALHNYVYEDFMWFSVLERDDYTQNCRENLSYLTKHISAHPETEFIVFLPPYSMLMWEKCRLDGTVDAVLELVSTCAELLSAYDNVRFFSFLDKAEVAQNLDNYMDSLHFTGAVSRELVDDMAAGAFEVTKENRAARMQSLADMLAAYDFEALEEEVANAT